MTRWLLLTAAVVVTAVVVAAGVTRSGEPGAAQPPTPAPDPTTSGSPTEPPDPTPTRVEPPPSPRTGACYRLSYDEAVAPTASARPVPCREPHTAATYLVGRLDAVAGGHLVAVDSERVRDQVARTCPARFAEHVGGTLEQRRLSVLRPVWFTPSVEESDAGARWFRCDVIAVGREGALAPLGRTVEGALDTAAGRARYGLCATAEPGTRASQRVSCSSRHSWRAVRTVGFAARRYPGTGRVRAAGQRPCRAAGQEAAGDRLDFRWGYEWPTARQWRDGQHHGICWVPS